MNNRFIQTEKLYQLLDLETFIFILSLGLMSFLFYKFFLKEATASRHTRIKTDLKKLVQYFILLSAFFTAFSLLSQTSFELETIRRLLPYLAFTTFLIGIFCFVKTCRLLVLQYLFLSSMRTGVPLLLVNIFSLILSILIAFWTINNIFGVQVTPLLATSAAFSIILGLALQDTLGNIFAGISMQVDNTFEIDDWLEIMNGSIKIIGQVKEITWRSTLLVGLADEVITLPNKLLAQCQISNFSPETGLILRSQTFKFGSQTDITKATQLLEQAAVQISDVQPHPAPFAFVLETNDYGISVKLIYYIESYGRQYSIGDKVLTTALDLLRKNNIYTANPTIQIKQHPVL